MEQGLVIIYTGEGKGKTTAALGAAFRAQGYFWKVLMLQFGKEEAWRSGEREAQKLTPNFIIKALGAGFYKILGDQKPKQVHRERAHLALEEALKAVRDSQYDLVILDELIGTLAQGFLGRKDIEGLLAEKRPELHLIMTGRYVPNWLIEKADLVTEMKEIKHPFQKGKLAVKGIDF